VHQNLSQEHSAHFYFTSLCLKTYKGATSGRAKNLSHIHLPTIQTRAKVLSRDCTQNKSSTHRKHRSLLCIHDCAYHTARPRPSACDAVLRCPSASRAACSGNDASHLVPGNTEPGYLQMQIMYIQPCRSRQARRSDDASKVMGTRRTNLDLRIYQNLHRRAIRRYRIKDC